jgi:hypothetical protein
MNLIIGLLLATLGGGIQGAFVYPLKFMKNFQTHNSPLKIDRHFCPHGTKIHQKTPQMSITPNFTKTINYEFN